MTEDHRDASLSPDVRAELLLRQLTLEEKCGQLVGTSPWHLVRPDGSDADEVEELLRRPPGHIAQLSGDDPVRLSRLTGAIQRQLVTRTRLGIPALIHQEALNGFLAGGHMVFPTAIGLAATFSPGLVEQMADLIRRQMRRLGFAHALSPVMDVALDPRWGRVHETYGEDPYLCAVFSVAYTRGLQGDDPRTGVIATGKHFLGYSLASGGLNLSAYEGGPRRTRDLFAYPFEAAIQVAGLKSVMNSYADVDGVPVSASREVLTELLRDTLGFDGFVASDYTSLQQLVTRQRVAATPGDAARLGITAGLDVELPDPYAYGSALVEEVRRGTVDEREVDPCVRRVLRAKFESGLFENPYPAEHIDVTAIAGEGAQLSRQLARESVVLVKNDGLLPLAASAGLTVAVVGPHADAVTLQFPAYSYPAYRELLAVQAHGQAGNAVGVAPAKAEWLSGVVDPVSADTFVRDSYSARPLCEEIAQFAKSVHTEPGCTLTRLADTLEQAVEAARQSDVVVLALGGASLWFIGERTEGENSDSADIALPAAQAELAEAVAATGKPLVVVLVQGRAYALPEVVRNAPAIVVSSYGGPFGPKAVAEVLFGAVNPSGKLPYSIPRHSGQIPLYHHQKTGTGYRNPLPYGVPTHYLDMAGTPLYPFGHGLSYTTFELSELSCEPEIGTSGSAGIGATITNTGSVEGATVVQLYVRVDSASGVTRPAQQLAGFSRVELAPGESRRITFRMAAAQLGHTNLARDFAVEPGHVEFFVGLHSDDRALSGSFELAGPARVLGSAERSFLSEVTVD